MFTSDSGQGIRKDLETVLDTGKLTAHDKFHNENEKSGMDKFSTMKRAQSGLCSLLRKGHGLIVIEGDAKRRVEDFEKLDDTDC